MKKICACCGKEFEAKDGRSKYCSEECRAEARKQYQTEYFEKWRKTEHGRQLVNASSLRTYRKSRHALYVEKAKELMDADFDDVDSLAYVLEKLFTMR